MRTDTHIGFVLLGILLIIGLFGAGMWVGVWIDDEKNTPDAPDPESPEVLRLMHIARIMQKVQDSIAANNGLMYSSGGTVYDGMDDTGAFDDGFNEGFS